MKRDGLLEDNALVRELVELKKNLREFAGRQPVSGASGIVSYEAKTNATWDYSATIGADADSGPRTTTITVDFTGDGSQDYPIENIFASIFANGTTLADQPTLRVNGLNQWTDNSGRVLTIFKWGASQSIYWGDKTKYRWVFEFTTFRQITVYFKAFAAGSSPGTLSIASVVTI